MPADRPLLDQSTQPSSLTRRSARLLGAPVLGAVLGAVSGAGLAMPAIADSDCSACRADLTNDGVRDGLDVLAWVLNWQNGDLDPAQMDQNCDGLISPADFTQMLRNISTPCFGDRDGDGLNDNLETNTGVYNGPLDTGTDPDNPDTDGDNIPDGHEVLGWIGEDGTRGTDDDLDLPALGANPLRKDIFIETDWTEDSFNGPYHSHRITPQAVAHMQDAFANAPLQNPDGSTGVSVHIDFGQDAGTSGPFVGGTRILEDENPAFVATGRITGLRAAHLHPSRQRHFHYALLTHRYDSTTNNSSGLAVIGGLWMFVTLPFSYDDTTDVARTLMHELGHNLTLRHGGFENRNRKPNYPSVMNYNFQFPGVDIDGDTFGDGVTDYSRGLWQDLDENNLNEFDGIDPALGFPIDWDGDGTLETSVSRNINCWSFFDAAPCGSETFFCSDAACSTLRDSDDWARIRFLGRAVPLPTAPGGARPDPQPEELAHDCAPDPRAPR